MPEYAGCPACGSELYKVERRVREHALVCAVCGCLVRLFFCLVMPPVPPRPEPSSHAASSRQNR